MATTIDTSQNPLAAYGYDASTGQQLAQSLGLSTQQLADALATTPLTGGSAPQTTSYGMTTGGSPPGRDISSTIQQLQLMKAAGMGGGQQSQTGQAPSSTPGGVSQDPMNAAVNLGAQALASAGFSGPQGGFAVYNPTPGQIPQGSKGGVSTVASPVSSTAVPTGQTPNVASVFGQPSQQQQGLAYWASQHGGGTADEAAAIEKANGWPAGSVGNQFYQAGVQSGAIQPANSINPAPASGGTPTGVRPPNAPGAGQPATPFATAPPAPGVDPVSSAVHNTALQNAGMAMYAHYGGDPTTATHADIQNFHQQLTAGLGQVAGQAATPFGAAPPGAQNYTAGVPPGISAAGPPPATPPAAPVKMATGGYVPGDPNDDTDSVPAYLSPGEYVMSKDEQNRRLSEARHQTLTTDRSAPAPQTQDQNQTTQAPATAPAAPGLGGYTGPTASQIQAQNTAANNAIGSGGKGSLDSLGTLGDEGLIGSMGVGVGSGPGSGMPTKQAAGVASGLASGLSAAAQAYADSIKSWQVQASHIPQPQAQQGPAATFQQNQIV